MVLRSSHLDAYDRVCDELAAADLEPVLTSELTSLPKDVLVFVLEKHLPRIAIDALNELGSRVVCPHEFFVDENGDRVARKHVPKDFYDELRSAKDGPALTEAFLRVEEKEHNLAYGDLGATIGAPSELAPEDAHKARPAVVNVQLPGPKRIYGTFVQLHPGDAYSAPSRIPDRVRVLVSADGQGWTEVASLSNITSSRIRVRFEPCEAAYIRFDLGDTTGKAGLRITEAGVLGE
jgi:hypothetical protein